MINTMKIKKCSLFLLIALLLIGCGNSGADHSESSSDIYYENVEVVEEVVVEVEHEVDVKVEAVYELAAVSSQGAAANPVQERVIIRNGYIELIVADPEAMAIKLGRQAAALGGWVVDSQLSQAYNDDTRKRATITLRVPSDQFQAVIDDVKRDALDIINENTSGRDVTDEFVDLSARLDNLQATEARVQTFLDETQNVEEALDVNRELSRLQEEIEVIAGRLKYLRESADYSSITVSLIPDSDARPIQIASWQPQGTARNAVEFLLNFLQGLADLLIWLAIVGLPLLIVLWLARWWLRRVWRATGWPLPTFSGSAADSEPSDDIIDA